MAQLYPPLEAGGPLVYPLSDLANLCTSGLELRNVAAEDLEQVGVTNNIIKRKLMNWIREGFIGFEAHLKTKVFDWDKENVAPLLNRIETSQMR